MNLFIYFLVLHLNCISIIQKNFHAESSSIKVARKFFLIIALRCIHKVLIQIKSIISISKILIKWFMKDFLIMMNLDL